MTETLAQKRYLRPPSLTDRLGDRAHRNTYVQSIPVSGVEFMGGLKEYICYIGFMVNLSRAVDILWVPL